MLRYLNVLVLQCNHLDCFLSVALTLQVTAFVLKKAGQAKQLLEDQRRKEQTMMAGSGDAAEEDTVGADKASAPGDKKAGKPKLPVVTVAEIDEKTLNKLKLGKAEQYIFVFAQVL